MSSALLYQWLFLRLSRRFTIPFLSTAAILLGLAFPPLARRAEDALPPLLAALAVLGLFAVSIVASLWAATAVYRLFPSRPTVWFHGTEPRLSIASSTATPLGRYRRIGIILAGLLVAPRAPKTSLARRPDEGYELAAASQYHAPPVACTQPGPKMWPGHARHA